MAALIGHIAALHHMTTVFAYASKLRASNSLEQVAHLLPGMIRDLGERIGLHEAFAISKIMGGTSLLVPSGMKCATARRLIEQLGDECLAKKISTIYRGEVIYIPRSALVERALRDIEIHRFAETEMSCGKSLSAIVRELASMYRLSDRRVWEILKAPPPNIGRHTVGGANALHTHPQQDSEIH